MVALRWQWFRSDEYQNTLHARSLIVSRLEIAGEDLQLTLSRQ